MLSTNNNVMAFNVGRSISHSQMRTASSVARLGSGRRIERAADDAAGLSISEGMRSELVQLSQNVRNAETANDLLQVSEGSLGEASRILGRMRELTVAAANSHLIDSQREILDSELNQSRTAMDRLMRATTYNNDPLLAGRAAVDEQASTAALDAADTGVVKVELSGAQGGTYTFEDSDQEETLTLGNGIVSQTLNLATPLHDGRVADGTRLIANFDRLGIRVTLGGAGASPAGDYESGDLDGKSLVLEEEESRVFHVSPTAAAEGQLELELPDLRPGSEALDLGGVSISSQLGAREALAKIDFALEQLSRQRGKVGALQNRLGYTIEFSENEIEKIQSSESTLRDADVAFEASRMSRAQILSRTSSAMLTQAFGNARRALQLI